MTMQINQGIFDVQSFTLNMASELTDGSFTTHLKIETPDGWLELTLFHNQATLPFTINPPRYFKETP